MRGCQRSVSVCSEAGCGFADAEVPFGAVLGDLPLLVEGLLVSLGDLHQPN